MLELRELPEVLHMVVRSTMRPLPTCMKHTGSALTGAGETLLSTGAAKTVLGISTAADVTANKMFFMSTLLDLLPSQFQPFAGGMPTGQLLKSF